MSRTDLENHSFYYYIHSDIDSSASNIFFHLDNCLYFPYKSTFFIKLTISKWKEGLAKIEVSDEVLQQIGFLGYDWFCRNYKVVFNWADQYELVLK